MCVCIYIYVHMAIWDCIIKSRVIMSPVLRFLRQSYIRHIFVSLESITKFEMKEVFGFLILNCTESCYLSQMWFPMYSSYSLSCPEMMSLGQISAHRWTAQPVDPHTPFSNKKGSSWQGSVSGPWDHLVVNCGAERRQQSWRKAAVLSAALARVEGQGGQQVWGWGARPRPPSSVSHRCLYLYSWWLNL